MAGRGARSGSFTRSLAPFGAGRLNLEDAYRIENPGETTTPPTPNPPPPKPVGGGPQSVPKPVAPKVGKTPIPRTSGKKKVVRRVPVKHTPHAVPVKHTVRRVPKPPVKKGTPPKSAGKTFGRTTPKPPPPSDLGSNRRGY